MNQIVLVRAEDWEGPYADGLLVYEAHRVEASDVLALVEGSSIVDLSPKQDRYPANEAGALPCTLQELETWK